MPPSRFEFPRKPNTDTPQNPDGITIIPQKGFSDLPLEMQRQVKQRQITLADAIQAAGFTDYDGAKTIMLSPADKAHIDTIYAKIQAQNDTARQILASLTTEENTHFRNAIALHISDNRRTLDAEQNEQGEWVDKPTYNNLYTTIATVMSTQRQFLSGTYTLKKLFEEGKRLAELEKNQRRGAKYTDDIKKYLLATHPLRPKEEAILLNILVQEPPARWHSCAKEQLTAETWQHLTTAITDFEQVSYAQTPNDPRRQGRLTESLLSLLNPERPKERLGEFSLSDGTTRTLWRLFTKRDLERESAVLGHCVGEGNTYYLKIKGDNPSHAIIGIHTADDTPEYTLEIDLKRQSILQFRGDGDRPVNSLPNNESYVLKTLTALAHSALPVTSIAEEFNYTIIKKDNAYQTISKVTAAEAIDTMQAEKATLVTKEKITLNRDITREKLNYLASLPNLTLDLTNVPATLKNQLQSCAGSIVDNSSTATYEQLVSIGGSAIFRNLTSAVGLGALASIGGSAYFWNLISEYWTGTGFKKKPPLVSLNT